MTIEKICIHHRPLTRDKVYLNGKNNCFQCKECKILAYHRYKERNQKRDTNKMKSYFYVGKGKVKVLKTDYMKLFDIQKGLCAICHLPEDMKQANNIGIKRLALDHCHKTNKIRGLLCHKCNTGIGSLKESIYVLQSAIKYLSK